MLRRVSGAGLLGASLLGCPSEPPLPASGTTTDSTSGATGQTGGTGGTGETDGSDFECQRFADGHVDIAGDLRIDLVFEAGRELLDAYEPTHAQLQSDLQALAMAWDFGAPAEFDAETVADLRAHIEAEIAASVTGFGIQVPPPACVAAVATTHQRQASCETEAGCASSMRPIQCEGVCAGVCDGACDTVSCDAPSCSGECRGTCDLEAAAACEGFCEGDCSGSCPVQDASKSCAGPCDGMCFGQCQMPAGGSCEGTCAGTCITEVTAACEGAEQCYGACSGSCEGECSGVPVPDVGLEAPCEVVADCSVGSSLLGAIATICAATPVLTAYEPAVGVDESMLADRMAALRSLGAAIVADAGYIGLLVTGDVDGDGDREVDPTLMARVAGDLNGLASADLASDFGLGPSAAECVTTELGAANEMVSSQSAQWIALEATAAELTDWIHDLEL